MSDDNATPMVAKVYDIEINDTIPYYQEFYSQTIDIVYFTLVDPSEKMLEQARKKLNDDSIQYICTDSASIRSTDCFDIVTAIQSHHYMHEEERKKQ